MIVCGHYFLDSFFVLVTVILVRLIPVFAYESHAMLIGLGLGLVVQHPIMHLSKRTILSLWCSKKRNNIFSYATVPSCVDTQNIPFAENPCMAKFC